MLSPMDIAAQLRELDRRADWCGRHERLDEACAFDTAADSLFAFETNGRRRPAMARETINHAMDEVVGVE